MLGAHPGLFLHLQSWRSLSQVSSPCDTEGTKCSLNQPPWLGTTGSALCVRIARDSLFIETAFPCCRPHKSRQARTGYSSLFSWLGGFSSQVIVQEMPPRCLVRCWALDGVKSRQGLSSQETAVQFRGSGIIQAWGGIPAPGAIPAGHCVALGHHFLICMMETARNCFPGLCTDSRE